MDGSAGNDTGKDRLAVGHNDDSSVVAYCGVESGGKDKAADCLTLLGTQGSLDFSMKTYGFERGIDRIDLTQLRDGGGNQLDLNDLVLSYSGGNANIGFAADVQTLAGGDVNVEIQLIGVSSLSASDFAFAALRIPSGVPGVDPGLSYLGA